MTLAQSPDAGSVRRQDVKRVFTSVASASLEGRDVVWGYLQENLRILTTYLGSFDDVGDIIEATAKTFSTQVGFSVRGLYNSDKIGDVSS